KAGHSGILRRPGKMLRGVGRDALPAMFAGGRKFSQIVVRLAECDMGERPERRVAGAIDQSVKLLGALVSSPRLSSDNMVERQAPRRPNQRRLLPDLPTERAGPAIGLSDFGGGETPCAHQERTERNQQGKLIAVALGRPRKLLQDGEPRQRVSGRCVCAQPWQGIVGRLPKVCHGTTRIPRFPEMTSQFRGPLAGSFPIPCLSSRADAPVKLAASAWVQSLIDDVLVER